MIDLEQLAEDVAHTLGFMLPTGKSVILEALRKAAQPPEGYKLVPLEKICRHCGYMGTLENIKDHKCFEPVTLPSPPEKEMP